MSKFSLLATIGLLDFCLGKGKNEIAVYVPPQEGGLLNTRNFAIGLMTLAFLYLVVMLIQVCR